MYKKLLDAVLNKVVGASVYYPDPLLRPFTPEELELHRETAKRDKEQLRINLTSAKSAPEDIEIAERLHRLRPSVSAETFVDQIKNPIASRGLAIWVEIFIPALNKTMILDTRADNPDGLPESIANILQNSRYDPWPEPKVESEKALSGMKGHGGSSCPGYLSGNAHLVYPINEDIVTGGGFPWQGGETPDVGGILGGGGFPSSPDGTRLEVPGGMHSVWGTAKAHDWLEIPVEVLAFHIEGENSECKYSIAMFSEVFGKVSTTLSSSEGDLNMWGKMMITLRVDNPQDYEGHEVIQLVSEEYIHQTGTITGFPPHNAGEYIESAGNERYVGVNPGQRHIEAIVKRGRIIFSTDTDDFLQARTRVTHFAIVDSKGHALNPGSGPPYSSEIMNKIAGVKMYWKDIRLEHEDVTHYLVYRVNMDSPKDFTFIGRSTTSMFYDRSYSGTAPLAYAVVPAFRDSVGMEVQGISLDHAGVVPVVPNRDLFHHRNHGVGHVRTV